MGKIQNFKNSNPYEEVKELIKKLEELGLGLVSKGPREGLLFKADKPWPTG